MISYLCAKKIMDTSQKKKVYVRTFMDVSQQHNSRFMDELVCTDVIAPHESTE
jgi:hypothetical protein